jgi:asparagine synthase (glutamine-hydrolysing)
MCGIAGFLPRLRGAETIAAALVDSLRSRGPDATSVLSREVAVLVHTRLAVIDLSPQVRYPIPNEDETVWLLFNGEIYDHAARRDQLERLGHRFRTRCDAEVVVHAWEEWGPDAFGRLTGMFAVAILDESTGKIILARDRLGIKPLVRTVSGPFAFSSDVLSLVRAGLSTGAIDREAIDEFALLHYMPSPLTGIADLRQVEPGTVVERRFDGSEETTRFAPAPFTQTPDGAVEGPTLEAALRDAVRHQLVADVGVGVLLSGGIDSSLILSFAAELGVKPMAFTVGFSGHGAYDERPAAERVARALDVPHVHADLEIDFDRSVHEVAMAYDMPFADSSAIATLQLARLARRDVTVVLSGTGGDDLFGGYYRHRAHLLLGLLQRVPGPLLRALAQLPSGRGAERRSVGTLAGSYLGRLGRADRRDPWSQYLAVVTDLMSSRALALFRDPPDWYEVTERIRERYRLGAASQGTLRELQRFELQTYVPGDLLVKEDRAAMAVGLEARVPLFDDRVIDIAERSADSAKISWRSGKVALRELAARRLPEGTARARKRGFAVPLADLLRGPWREHAREWFAADASDLVRGDAAPDLIDRDGGPTDVWALIALTAWERRLGAARRAAPQPFAAEKL